MNEKTRRAGQKKNITKTRFPSPAQKLPEERKDYTNVEERKDETKSQGVVHDLLFLSGPSQTSTIRSVVILPR
jgi:hypothetical protein